MRIMLLLAVLPLAWAQFPAVCNTQDSLSTKTCCPDNCGSHGTCVSIRETVERSWDSANATIVNIIRGFPGWPQDVRYQWPIKIFERVCSCSEGWGGHDCSRCDFGFMANEAGECVKRNTNQLLIRRNFMHLSKQERLNYIRLVNEAKNGEKKEWAIIARVPEEANGYYELQNVSTYDMFVFTHMLSLKEKDSSICGNILSPDNEFSTFMFAHKSSPFLPWHRYFVMRYESEMQQIGKRLGISNDFALPYWDWTPTDTCLVFTHELFGIPEFSDKLVNVSGTLFENGNWPIVCDQVYREFTAIKRHRVNASATECVKIRTLCDVQGDREHNRRLQRGAWMDFMPGTRLPTYDAVARTLIPDQYAGDFGFRSRLEGGVDMCVGEAEKCMFADVNTRYENMHAIVHEHIGGHVTVGPSAVNDPLFFLHHANVDRIFDRWLQKYDGNPPSYTPISGGPPGHNLNDYFMAVFPVKKIADVYKESKELGYIYDEFPWNIPATDYQVGCPSDQCDKGGYPPTVLVNGTSAYCTRIRKDPKFNGGV